MSVRALTRAGSGHNPLLIDSGEGAHLGNRSIFSFELSWLRQEGFYDMVSHEWMSISEGASPVERWQNKIRHLRQFLRGWAKNKSGEYRILRGKLLLLIDELDIRAESTPLSEPERVAKREAEVYLAKL